MPPRSTTADVVALPTTEELFKRHMGRVAGFLVRLTGPGPHVDDLLQETFLVAHRRRQQLRPDVNPISWLFGIAARVSRNHLRSKRRATSFLERWVSGSTARSHDPVPGLEAREELIIARQALDKMRPNERQIFVLFELEGVSGQEVAKILEVPIGTVWRRLHEARKIFMSTVEAARGGRPHDSHDEKR